jgi:hypothetical protein
MKKIVALFIGVLALSSCTQDIKTNDPAFQAKFGDAIWRANDARVFVDENGAMTITAYTQFEELTLATTSTNPGTYVFGTTNQNNYASYYFDGQGIVADHETSIFPGPVNKIANIVAGGFNYTNNSDALTTGGSGSGLKLAIEVNNNGTVNKVNVVARGMGYVAGDVVTILGGNGQAKVRVLNVQQSNGEIKIISVDNGFFTGEFKFTAVDEEGNTVSFSKGEFYRIPLSQ